MYRDLSVRWRSGICVSVALCAVLLARGAVAQQSDPWDYRAPGLSRQELLDVLARYDAAAQSPAYSARLRSQALSNADSIRARLKDGDLHVGDRVRLRVEDQVQLSDTFAVSDGPSLVLPVIGSISLHGVLRSELEERVASSIDSVYRGVAVRVLLLTRVAVIGGVARPGYYALPNDALVPDAISAAGGLASDARLTDIYVERGRGRLWEPDSLQVAMREGRTLADLRLQSGDRFVIPRAAPKDVESTFRLITYALSLPLSLYALLQLVK